MAHESLQAVIGTAVIDTEFRKALLNGSRQRVIQRFALSREEFDAVMRVRADSLEQFAGQLDQWILRAQGRAEPPALRALPSLQPTLDGVLR
ncbi:MAG: Os1348 family NHLP clan protein [Chloroflexota bacterium]